MKAGARFWLLLALCVGQAHAGDFHWPDGRKAAVSLAYDDALDSQLDNALPVLDRLDRESLAAKRRVTLSW